MRIRINYRNGSHENLEKVRSTSFYVPTNDIDAFSGLIVYLDEEIKPRYISFDQIASVWSYEASLKD